MKDDPAKKKTDQDASDWDSSSMVPSTTATVPLANTPVSSPASVPAPTTKQQTNGVGKDESEWDSENDDDTEASSTGPSEQVLPPRTPEPGSEFEPFSSGDEEESDFSLGESYAKVFDYFLIKLVAVFLNKKFFNLIVFFLYIIYFFLFVWNTKQQFFLFSFQLKNNPAKNDSKVVEGGVIGGGSGIFQTEIETGTTGGGFDSSDEDDIEQQMLNMSKQKLNNNQAVGQLSSPLKSSASKEVTSPGSGSKQVSTPTGRKSITKPLSSMFRMFDFHFKF